MSEVFLCERGQLTGPSKSALRKAGVVVVEVEDPSKCQFIRSTEVVSADDMLWAVLDAINATSQYSSGMHDAKMDRLGRNLLHVVNEQRFPKTSAS